MLSQSARTLGTSSFSIAFACLFFSSAANATTYDAVNDFSFKSNPNGVWSYLYGGALLPTPVVGTGTFAGLHYWYDSMAVPNSTVVGENVSGRTLHYESIIQPVDHLEMDPESISSVDVRFTASAAGNYHISGDFLGIDVSEHSHPVRIFKDGVDIFSGTIGAYAQSDPFDLLQSLAPGDTLDLSVLTGRDFHNLSTGLAASVATVTPTAPEPATIWIAGPALIVLSFLRRHKATSC